MKIEKLKIHETYFLTVSEFLHKYYGFQKNLFPSFTHEDLDLLLPDIKRTQKKNIIHENIYQGKILLVKDVKGTLIAYDNPLLLEELDYVAQTDNSKAEVDFIKEKPEDYSYVIDENLQDLNNLELKYALDYFKKIKNYKMIRLIKKEFKFRPKKGSKQRKREKEIKKERIEVE